MTQSLRTRLAQSLRERPSPVLLTAEGTIPAASLWIGSRLWVRAFRAAGLRPGDRVVLALPPSAAFVEVLVAALWEGLTLAPVAPGADPVALLDELDAALAVVPAQPGDRCLPLGLWGSDGCAGPHLPLAPLRPRHSVATPAAALLLGTSGTSGSSRWVALSESNLCAVLDSHQPMLALADAYVVSVLPWHHAFGLILDLLPALAAGAYIARDPSGGRDVDALAGLLRQAPASLCAVPATIEALAARPDGAELLGGLSGGIVGGAGVRDDIVALLAGTTLRVGYGQTEASPGIALGEPGRWRPGLLGRALGCEVRIQGGVLEFRGANACLGTWSAGGLRILDPARWVSTGDAVDVVDGELFYRGRMTDRFKLSNGRWVDTTSLEPALRAALPPGADVLLFTATGGSLDALVVEPLDAALDADLVAGVVRRVVGPLRALLGTVRVVARSDVVRSGKGGIDRAATVRTVALTGRP